MKLCILLNGSFAIALLLSTGTSTITPVASVAPGDDCYLTTDNDWVKVMLYRETVNGQKGAPVWRQPLEMSRGATKRIPHGQSGEKHVLRYDYTLSPLEKLQGDVEFSCKNNEKVTVPAK